MLLIGKDFLRQILFYICHFIYEPLCNNLNEIVLHTILRAVTHITRSSVIVQLCCVGHAAVTLVLSFVPFKYFDVIKYTIDIISYCSTDHH